MKMGRPTSYDESMVQQTYDYIKNYSELGDSVPSIEGLAVELGVVISTIYAWEKQEEKADFSKALGKLRATQARVCINKGLDATFNAAITKLMLHNHGYSDKLESRTFDMTPKVIKDDVPSDD